MQVAWTTASSQPSTHPGNLSYALRIFQAEALPVLIL